MNQLLPLLSGGLCTGAAADFAESVTRLVTDHGLPAPDAWRPGAWVDDADPVIRRKLSALGWYDLAPDGASSHVFLGAGGVALGRALVSLAEVDGLLGAAPMLEDPSRRTALVRHGSVGSVAAVPVPGGLRRMVIEAAERRPYLDSWGVWTPTATRPDGDDSSRADHADRADDDGNRHAAWVAAHTGYLAGMAAAALDLTLGHARHRVAFGSPLTSLDAVQQKLADSATTVDGMILLACTAPSPAGLAYAAAGCVEVLGHCHQVTGALGFTLEFPLQRYLRRAVASQVWVNAWLSESDE